MSELEKPPVEPEQCPTQMPISYFGAWYPDSQCIDGYLWDEDSCEEAGGPLYNGGDIPCPFCNPIEHTDYQAGDFEKIVCSICGNELTNYHWATTNKPSIKLYGLCCKCNSNQWAKVIEDNSDD